MYLDRIHDHPMMKINYTQIALKANLSKQFLSNIVAGRKRPSWTTAKRLAEATNSSPVDWLESPPDILRKIIEQSGVNHE